MYRGSKCAIIDNSGARIGRLIYLNHNSKPADLGSIVLVSIIKRDFNRRRIRLGQVFRAVVLGRGFPTGRVFGHIVQSFNIVVLLRRTDIVTVSKRIKGPIPIEFRRLQFLKLIAMGTYVF